MYGKDINSLVGRTVEAIQLSSDAEQLFIHFTDGTADKLQVEADCCSSTWIEHVQGVKQFVGATVTAVDNLDMPDLTPDDDCTKGDCIQYYGLKITTTNGALVIDYRNASNGYYGGSICLADTDRVPFANPLTEDM